MDRNERIYELVEQGYPYNMIANEMGLSRERIRQIVNTRLRNRKLPKLVIPHYVVETEIAKLTGTYCVAIIQLREKGIIVPILSWTQKNGHTSRRYSTDAISKVIEYMAIPRLCAHCSSEMTGTHLQKYCKKCTKEKKRYSYPFLSEEGRKRSRECSRNWWKNNPDRYQVIQRRANQKRKLEKSKKQALQLDV